MKEFDEKQAIKVMRGALSPESSKLYVDDEILNIIDIIGIGMKITGFLTSIPKQMTKMSIPTH